MDRKELGKKIFEVSYLTGQFLLRSGQISTEYFDKYQFESRPELLREIAGQLMLLLPDEVDVLAGLELGGIPLATALSLQTNIPLVFVRKQPKKYGTQKVAEGVSVKGRRVVVIEDVVTTGGQILESVQYLRAEGASVSYVLCVIDREAGAKEKLDENGLRLISLFTMSELRSSATIATKRGE